MQKKILVTGGCDFIGANLVPKLIEHSAEVRVLDDFSNGNASNLQNVDTEIIEGDVRDPSIVKNAVSGITLEDGIAKTWDWFSRNFSKS
ncbi:NAD-dependent epimerase/dehydratase family protein [Candidatus Parcubacteria bacterium]|nr:NAD-dependent epimerase/dehydratase family protein [Candidatus Parcubacteria bacterium]